MSQSKRDNQPNILLVMADQLMAGAVGAYGNACVHTPHIDALAQSGAKFSNFYCNSPICAASRASMMTGQHPHHVDVYDNGSELRSSIPTFAHLLQLAGYHTALSGKMHFVGPDQLHGFRERLTTDIYPASFAWTPDWENGVELNEGSNVKPLRDSGICKWNLQLRYDEEVHYQSLCYLRQKAKHQESESTPFFLCASYTHPHDPFVTTHEWWNLYADEKIDLPTVGQQPSSELHPYNQWLQVHHGIDQFPLTEAEIRASRRAYYGMVSYFDQKVGELVAELKRLGLYENTLVIVTSDHGEMLGEHGMWFKRTFYEEAVQVPMIVSWDQVIPAGRTVDRIVSLVDLFPSLCEVGQVPGDLLQPLSLDGDSFFPLLFNDNANWKNYALIEYCGEGVLQSMRALRTQSHKYVYVENHPPLLFDLEHDPHERENIAGSPHAKEIEEALAQQIRVGWDFALREKVMRSQKQRRLLNRVLNDDSQIGWDYRATPDQPRRFIRKSTQGEKIESRFPFIFHSSDTSQLNE